MPVSGWKCKLSFGEHVVPSLLSSAPPHGRNLGGASYFDPRGDSVHDIGMDSSMVETSLSRGSDRCARAQLTPNVESSGFRSAGPHAQWGQLDGRGPRDPDERSSPWPSIKQAIPESGITQRRESVTQAGMQDVMAFG